jgi:hypothetical protein
MAKFPMTTEQGFGLSESQITAAQHKAPATAADVKELSGKVVALTDRPHAGFLVTLDNGQIWVQNEMETGHFVAVGDVVSIKPGRFGAFWLTGPSGRGTRVHRLR